MCKKRVTHLNLLIKNILVFSTITHLKKKEKKAVHVSVVKQEVISSTYTPSHDIK